MPCLDDNDLSALADGALTPAELARAHQHLELCATCRAIASGVENPDAAFAVSCEIRRVLARGSSIGRYTLLECIGQGGMGEVWAAFDPDLDRKVALKLLRPGLPNASAFAERLRREAQAMARLSHPNVVTVFDVGVDGEHVFIAMEFVSGMTLRKFLETPRTWRALLSVFAQAIEGIAAAHAAGVVHRDFKPENVFIGQDGRVRVGDFGLAHLADGARPAAAADAGTSGLAGTPRYMAPEQFAGRPVDERTDQFSVAVVLWEAVHGESPFPVADPAALRSAVMNGARRPPSRTLAPRHVQAALERALSVEPKERFPSVLALLRALSYDPWRRRKYRLVAALAVAGLATVGAGAWEIAGRLNPCRRVTEPMAAIWDPVVRDELQQRFLATGIPYAPTTFDTFAEHLDQYAAAWSTMRAAACVATREAGVRSAATLDRRMICLDSRLASATALIALITESLPLVPNTQTVAQETVEGAVQAVTRLPSLATCADEQALLAMQAPPDDTTTRARLRDAEAILARSEVLEDLGQMRAALPLAQSAVEHATELAYTPLKARALLHRARVRRDLADLQGAEGDLMDATIAAAVARDDVTAARVLISRATLAEQQGRVEEGLSILRTADAAVLRAGDPAGPRSMWHGARGTLFFNQRRYDEAWTDFEQALTLDRGSQRSGGDDPTILTALTAIRFEQGRFEESLALGSAALEQCDRKYGAEHPFTVKALVNVATSLNELGRTEEGLARLELALERTERVLGSEHPAYAEQLSFLASVLNDVGRFDEAVAAARRVVAIYEKVYGPKHARSIAALVHFGGIAANAGQTDEALEAFGRAERTLEEPGTAADPGDRAAIEHGIASVLMARGRFVEALHRVERAVALDEAAVGADTPIVAHDLVSLGVAQLYAGRYAEGRETSRRALAMAERRLGADNAQLWYALMAVAQAELACRDPAAAIAPARRAIALITAAAWKPELTAGPKLMLARALWETGQDCRQAAVLGKEAKEHFLAAGGRDDLFRREIDAFLDAVAKEKGVVPPRCRR